jgi:hypothetical protein
VLRFYCDLDTEQAAMVLGCSAGTVKSQTSKGLAALRRMLEPAWGTGPVTPGGDLIVDEAGVRTLLGQLADTEPPPARIDLDAAMTAGRRGRWWRRARAGGSVLLAAVAVAAAAGLLAGPGQRPGQQATGGLVAPARFDVLLPYASFGWLPPGFQTGAAGGTTPASRPAELILVAVSHGAFIELIVNPAGPCHLAGRALLCSTYNTMDAVQSRAPDVNRHRAYWLLGAKLAWEYAPGAWAVLDWTDANVPWPPSGAQRAAVLRVAAGVRYGQTAPMRFPYWISGLPAGWQVSEVDYTPLAGQLVVQTLHVDDGPGDADVDEVQIVAAPAAHSGISCSRATGQHVTVGRVAAVIYSAGPEQQLCIPDWRGLRVLVILTARQTAPAPDPTGAHGVLAYARTLHPLGPDPAHWTANPLR